MAAHKPEQVMSPSGPTASPLESGAAGSGGFSVEDPRSSRQEPLLGVALP